MAVLNTNILRQTYLKSGLFHIISENTSSSNSKLVLMAFSAFVFFAFVFLYREFSNNECLLIASWINLAIDLVQGNWRSSEGEIKLKIFVYTDHLKNLLIYGKSKMA